MLKSIDIFCDVIDNFGDIGFVYRLAKEIKKNNPILDIRVFLNEIESFSQINKKISTVEKLQKIDGISYYDMTKMSWDDYVEAGNSQVAIEAFGCDLPGVYLNNHSKNLQTVINIEYLTAEDWAKDYHLKSAYINTRDVKKFFYMPGFESWSGGIIIPEDKHLQCRNTFFNEIILEKSERIFSSKMDLEIESDTLVGTVFSYEYNFEVLINTLEIQGRDTVLLVFGQMSKEGFLISKNIDKLKNVSIVFMDYLDQEIYDIALYNSDFNFVRGEESFARAIVSGKPFIWHSYCQEELEHMNKVNAFLSFFKKFSSKETFKLYDKSMNAFNSRDRNNYDLTGEDFIDFFNNLDKIGDSFKNISASIKGNGNLVKKLIDFLHDNVT